MPVFELRCSNPKCNHKFEIFQVKLGDDKKVKCPKCGSDAKKLVSGFSFRV